MVAVGESERGNKFQVNIDEGFYECTVVDKPFYDPKKKIANS